METSGKKVKKDKKGLMLFMYFGFYWTFDGIIVLLKSTLSKMNKSNEFNASKSLEWFYSCSMILADVLIILFQFISKKKSDKKFQILSPVEISKDYKKYKLLFVSSILEFLIRISDFAYMIALVRQIYPIGMIFLFSYDIIFRYIYFKAADFKENKRLDTFTVILMSIICPFVIYFFCLYRRDYLEDYMHYILLALFKNLMVPLRDVINDYLMSKKQVEPSEIMSFRGIVNLILLTIITLFICTFHFTEYFSFFNDGLSFWMLAKITLFSIIIIASMNKYFTLLVTIKKYSSLPAVFSYLLIYILKYIEIRNDSMEEFFLNYEDIANIFYVSIAIYLVLAYCKIIKPRFAEENKRNIEMKDYAIEETNPSTEDSYDGEDCAQTKNKKKDKMNIFNSD